MHARKLLEFKNPPFPVKGPPPPNLSLRRRKPGAPAQAPDANAEDRQWADWQNRPKRVAAKRDPSTLPIHVAEAKALVARLISGK